MTVALFIISLIAYFVSGAFKKPGRGLLVLLISLVISPTIVSNLPPPFGETRASDLLLLLIWFSASCLPPSGARLSLKPKLVWFLLLSLVMASLFANAHAQAVLGAEVSVLHYLVSLQGIQPMVMLWIAYRAAKYGANLSKYLPYVLGISSMVASGFGLLQYYDILGVPSFIDGVYPQFFYEHSQFSENNMRITSTFDGSSNVFGCYLVIINAILLGHLWQTKKHYVSTCFVLSINSIALVLTGSRTQMLSFIAVLVFFSIKLKWLVLVTAALIVTYLFWMPEIHQLRWQQVNLDQGELGLSGGAGVRWEKITQLGSLVLQTSPIIGFGTSGFMGSTSDVAYLRTLLDSGLVGLTLQLAMMFLIGKVAYSNYKNAVSDEDKALCFSFITIVCAISIGNFGARPLEMPRVGDMFWVLCGIMYAISYNNLKNRHLDKNFIRSSATAVSHLS